MKKKTPLYLFIVQLNKPKSISGCIGQPINAPHSTHCFSCRSGTQESRLPHWRAVEPVTCSSSSRRLIATSPSHAFLHFLPFTPCGIWSSVVLLCWHISDGQYAHTSLTYTVCRRPGLCTSRQKQNIQVQDRNDTRCHKTGTAELHFNNLSPF